MVMSIRFSPRPPAGTSPRIALGRFALLFLGLFAACAGAPSKRDSPIFAPEESPDPVGIPFAGESLGEIPEGLLQKLSPIERIVLRVKQNSPEISKQVVLEQDSSLTVKANLTEDLDHPGEIEDFEVIYDLKHAVPLDPPGKSPGFWVSFSVKSLETGDLRQDRLQWVIQEDAGGILLAFDDDYQEVWESNFERFDRYGAKVTFFVKGKPDSFCRRALNHGHDLGYHTLNHLNLLQVSPEVFLQETLSPLEDFRRAGIPLHAFAYPFGFSEPWMHEELCRFFKIQRGYGVRFRVYDRESIGEGYISSTAIDNILYKQDEDFELRIQTMLRTVKFIGPGRILPLTTHTISDTADWGIKPRRLDYLLQTAKDLKLHFYRYQDF